MAHEISLKAMQKATHGTYKSYMIGLAVSLILTSISFLLVVFEVLPSQSLMFTIAGIALLQATLQLIFFLHLGKEGTPHWETAVFFFMFVVLLIIVLGSLWIMHDLNERTMDDIHKMMTHD